MQCPPPLYYSKKGIFFDNNDSICLSGSSCVGAETAEMIHHLWRQLLSTPVSLSLRSFLVFPNLYMWVSFHCFQHNINRQSFKFVGGRTRWLKVSNGSKDSVWSKGFISLQSDSWAPSKKQITKFVHSTPKSFQNVFNRQPFITTWSWLTFESIYESNHLLVELIIFLLRVIGQVRYDHFLHFFTPFGGDTNQIYHLLTPKFNTGTGVLLVKTVGVNLWRV